MNEKIYKYDFTKKIKTDKFSVKQTQLKWEKSYYAPGKKTSSKVTQSFDGEYVENKNFNSENPTLLLSIKDNSELLKITLNNLHTHKVNNSVNVLVIDDRPSDESNKKAAMDFNCSYIKINNSANIFNFSMLHNLAVHALTSNHKNLGPLILWNSDLWVNDEDTLPELLKLHLDNQSTISGTKLLYPDESFPYHNSSKGNTVQFGGSMFGPRPGAVGLFPLHLYRGYEADNEKVNCNKGEMFITGAFMIVDSKWFIESGGFCPLFTICFQDVDLCLRASMQNKKIFYFGKNLELYHYESYIRGEDDSNMEQSISDDAPIYTGIWSGDRITSLLFKFW